MGAPEGAYSLIAELYIHVITGTQASSLSSFAPSVYLDRTWLGLGHTAESITSGSGGGLYLSPVRTDLGIGNTAQVDSLLLERRRSPGTLTVRNVPSIGFMLSNLIRRDCHFGHRLTTQLLSGFSVLTA